MACNLSSGREEVCKESVGGIQGVYFLNYQTGSAFDYNETTGQITGSTGFSGENAYYYELKGTSAYTETVNSSRENGTTFFTQELTLNLKKLTNEMTTQLKLMAYGRPRVVVHTNNGDALLIGQERGADVTAGTIQTGGGLGDLYGYSVTLSGEEKFPAAFISGSTIDDPFAGITGPTIVG
jgi:hypothetical protein